MRKTIHLILLVALLAVGLPSARGFSLLGPLGNAAGGEPWQQQAIGHLLPGDIGGVHNIGEEYRRVTPYMYYAYNANFLGYFGLAGTTNCDAAFAIMNSVMGTNDLSSYTPALDEFPFDSQAYNALAEGLFLTDLKSSVLHLLVEQMGLAQPERYVWTLHDRLPGNGSPCYLTVLYLVVMRNFNILDTPLNEIQYSAYVNDILYTYYIQEFCSGTAFLSTTVPVPANASQLTRPFSAVASFGLQRGGFYTTLTKDDVAGLRYLMNSNNINWEPTASSGGRLLLSNALAQTTLTTLPLSLLYGQAAVTDPATLQTNYPGLIYLSVQTNIVNLFTTNVVAYYTNLAGPFTNRSPNFPGWSPVQYGGFQTNATLSLVDFIAATTNSPSTLQGLYPDLLITLATTNSLAVQVATNVTPTFTNLFAPFTNFVAGFPPSVNFPGWQPLQYGNFLTLPTLSLSEFMSAARTNDPAALQSQYPGLIITSAVTNSLAVIVTTNIAAYFTNQTVLPIYSNNIPSGLGVGYYFTNQPGPTVINYPLTSQLLTNVDLFQFTLQTRTNGPAALLALYPNLGIVSYYSTPTNQDIPNILTYFTNSVGENVGTPPHVVTVTNGTTRIFYDLYYYQFGNIVTNHVYNSSFVTIVTTSTTNHVGANVNSPNITNVTTASYYTNLPGYPSGDILIIPTNWCGFQVTAAYPLLPVVGVSNTLASASAVRGTNTFLFSRAIFYTFTNRTYNVIPGICNPKLVMGTNFSTNIANVYQYSFGNVLTNHFYPTTLVKVYTNYIFSSGGVGTNLTTNMTVIPNSYYTNIPSGDIFIVPTNWCGYTYTTLLTNLNFTTNIFTAGGIATSGQSFSQTNISFFTNYTLSIRPGFCQPKVVNFTTYTTNIAPIYSYNFGNIFTNRFYNNTVVRVVTSNVFFVTGGSVGAVSNSVTVTTNVLNQPSGDIFIIPTNWCGYTYTVLLTNLNTFTNVVFGAGPSGSGEFYSETTISFLTNYLWSVRPGFCEPALVVTTNYSTNQTTTYNYVFSGIITNRFNPNTQARVVTSNLMLVPFGLVGALTNLVTTNFVNIGPSGDFFIVPPNFCALTIVSNLANNIATATNQLAATIAVGPDLGQRYTQTATSSFTNSTFVVRPYVCSTAVPSTTLRRGIEHIQFIRANFDSLLGQFFVPITNRYTMTVITNSQQVTETYQRVVATPDFLFDAVDLATSPSDDVLGVSLGTRSIGYDASQILLGLKGPGTILPPTIFTLNKVGPAFINGPFLNTNAFLYGSPLNTTVNEFSQRVGLLQWASYDTATNSIVLYPNGTSIANLANSIYIQMLPATLVDGNVGSYYAVGFSATGGQPPYTWSAPNLTSLVPGMDFNVGTQTLFGTPNTPGTFNFVIRLIDSVNRTVDYNYTLIIH
jgi:hypothetical protein